MDEVKVIWTHIAVRQRNLIFDYWNNRNKSTAYSKKLKLLLKQKTNIIKEHSDIGKHIKHSSLRVLFFSNYSIIYTKDIGHIYIMGFWDNRQNPRKLHDLLGL
ncbi:ParE toxin of type II toxin-antitoxin system, parDE [Chryseobacterium soldanellicola]|uniref:ParE toxin of type II toxin-antitoxin system, parDE n=1 Tax=Chryseobacterium soldanellicola TaxID=311333 RepID=A0A1H1FK02_9FLAO|nr:type II toxin-antitoxin system RelE/ParE family toxin [Chryseobacterium soldanellicola]SDR01069.1 ParE toxin of type II toxin-antitoxin system, parDE [Chryseobacterium soldanellicola]